MEKMGIAAQVYSVRDEAAKDFAGTMAALKEFGYEGVELAGLYGHSPEDIRDCLKEAGLEAVSAHVGLDLFLNDMEGTLNAYRTIGCSYIGLPGLPGERMYGGAQYEENCRFLEKLGAECGKYGMVLFYHNHTHEFEKTPSGSCLLDELFGSVDAKYLKTELDTGWAKAGGADPVEYLKKYEGRCPLVHMKDFQVKDGKLEQTALGEGSVEVEAIARTAGACGTKWMIVEQDDHIYGKPLDNMRTSINALRKLGF